MSSPRTVRVYQTPVIAARALAERIVTVSEQAMAVRGRFVIALAGGSTPQMAYDILSAEFGERVDWESTYVFWGDERAVPPESSQSNVRMARDHMLNFVPVPTAHVYRIRGEMPPEAAAREYEHTLRAFFGGRTESEMPRFDVLLLGMGADGHTASLFPGHAALRERERLGAGRARAARPAAGSHHAHAAGVEQCRAHLFPRHRGRKSAGGTAGDPACRGGSAAAGGAGAARPRRRDLDPGCGGGP